MVDLREALEEERERRMLQEAVDTALNEALDAAPIWRPLFEQQREALRRITEMVDQEDSLQSARAVAKEALGE